MWPKDLSQVAELQFGGEWHAPLHSTLQKMGTTVTFVDHQSGNGLFTVTDEAHVTGLRLKQPKKEK